MSYTQPLHQLQMLDNEIMAAEKRLQEISVSLVETEALKTAKVAMKQAEQAFEQSRAQMTNLDLEVNGLQQKIEQHEKQLYSGKVLSPKEASALQDDITSLKKWLSKREEDYLETMIEHEERTETRQARQEALATVRSTWEADQADLLQEQRSLRKKLKALTEQRARQTQFIDKSSLATYDRLRRKLGGVAVARVEGDLCLACGVIIPLRLIQQAQSSNQFLYCESCGRILHVV